MWNDALSDVVGHAQGAEDFYLLIGIFILAALAIGILRLVVEAFKYPPMLPMLVGSFGFWPLAFTGHPLWAMVAIFLGMGGMAAMQLIPRYAPKVIALPTDGKALE